MKILLVQPFSRILNPFVSKGPTVPPLGLMILGAILRDNGYQVKIIDTGIGHEGFSRIFGEFQPDVLGVSVLTGPMILDAIAISKMAKDMFGQKIKVVWGGVHPTLLPRQTLKNPYVDTIVTGEGEYAFLELVRAIENKDDLSNIGGLAFRRGEDVVLTGERPFIEDLDKLPLLPWDLIDHRRYLKYETSLMTSRGCPYKCGFCYNETVHHRKWRRMSAERVLREVEHAQSYGKIRRLKFLDDNFTVDRKRFLKIMQGLPKDIDLYVMTRVDNIDEELIEQVKRFKDVQFSVGIETGSPEMLKKLQKDITIEQVKKAFELLHKYKITSSASFIIGLPKETKEEVEITWKFVNEINPTKYICRLFLPFAGTELYRECVKDGLLKPPKTLEDWSTFGDDSKFTNVSCVDEDFLASILRKSTIKILLNYARGLKLKDLYDRLNNVIDDLIAVIKGKKFSTYIK